MYSSVCPADNLLPPDEDIADMHDRVKHFCGVKNEELLEKLRSAAGLAKMVATIN